MLEQKHSQHLRVGAYESASQAFAAQTTDLGRLTVKGLQTSDGIDKRTTEKDPRAARVGQSD